MDTSLEDKTAKESKWPIAQRLRTVSAWAMMLCFFFFVFGEFFVMEWVQTPEGTWQFIEKEEGFSLGGALLFILFLFIGFLSFLFFAITGFVTRFFYERSILPRQIGITELAYYLSWVFIFMVMFEFLTLLVIPEADSTDTLSWYDMLIPSLLISFIGIFLYRRNLTFLGFVRPTSYWWMAIVSVGLYCVLFFFLDEWLIDQTTHLLGIDPTSYREDLLYDALSQAKKTGWFVLFALALDIGVIGPIAEEVLFRGFLQQALVRRIGTIGGVLLSSFLFAAIHIDIAYFAPLFVAGLMMGILRVVFRSIWAPILLHIVNNTVAVVLAVMEL